MSCSGRINGKKVEYNVAMADRGVDRKSNGIKVNEEESAEKGTANERQGRRQIRAQQSVAPAAERI